MAGPGSERAALAVIADADEALTYALLRRDADAASAARARKADAEQKLAKSRRGRLGARVASELAAAAVDGDDPIAAALAGGITYDDLIERWERGELTAWLSGEEAAAVQEGVHALRLVLFARARGEEFDRAAHEDAALRRGHSGYALAARTTTPAQARAVASLIAQYETDAAQA